MKKYFILLFTFISFTNSSYAQYTFVQGNIIDAITGEPLIGASIIYGKGQGVSANYNGEFQFSLPNGSRVIKASYIGYKEAEEKIIANLFLTKEKGLL